MSATLSEGAFSDPAVLVRPCPLSANEGAAVTVPIDVVAAVPVSETLTSEPAVMVPGEAVAAVPVSGTVLVPIPTEPAADVAACPVSAGPV